MMQGRDDASAILLGRTPRKRKGPGAVSVSPTAFVFCPSAAFLSGRAEGQHRMWPYLQYVVVSCQQLCATFSI